MMEYPKMKAIVYENYGSPEVLQLNDVGKPNPSEDEALVEVHAASVNYIDWQLLTGKSFFLRLLNGLFKPKHQILGDDIAGRIEKVGGNVEGFKPGDEVFGISDFGAFAEYSCVNQEYLGIKPANLTFEEAAAVPYAGITALLGLRENGQIESKKKVLINGASGGVGTFAVQIAKSFGAEVTGVCSTNKLEMVRSIGADKVIDYTQEDFTKCGECYDLIFDIAAYHSIFDYKRALNPEGIYVFVGGSIGGFLQSMLLGPLISMSGNKKLGSLGWAKPSNKDFVLMKGLLESGKLVSIIDRRFALRDVPEALRYYGEGHAQGKVVINVK
jgi:NADPH:quinone reductase-like Zn-dependent oxidoreductase